MTNEEYTSSLFRKSFSDFVDKKILIYGIGIGTKSILDCCPEFNIVGLLDGIRKNEYLYDKYIYDIDDILSLNPDGIVIVARKATTRIIYRRINKFCRDNDIPIYSIYGKNLLEEFISNNIENEYFFLNEIKLKDEIDNHDVISFDIFDTLLMRKLLFPRDVFKIVSRRNKQLPFDFVSERISSEQDLLTDGNPNIKQIYNRLSERNNDYDTKHLMSEEIKAEEEILITRKIVVDLFKYAVESSKDVYIVSDMYLSKDILEKILSERGITGYKDILVSCEYGKSKCSGLFDILKTKINSKKCIHIGDNDEADGFYAKQAGFDYFLIKSSYDMMEISSLNKFLDFTSSFNDRLRISLIISEIFNSPFALYDSKSKPSVRIPEQLGLFVAPIISDFVIWMNDKVVSDKCDNVLLAARDGFLIKKMLDRLKNTDVKYTYLLVSRICSIVAAIKSKKNIEYLKKITYTGKPEDMMRHRYLLDENDISEYNDAFRNINEYIDSHASLILKKSEKIRENYLKYISDNNIDLSGKTGFFDFVSSGTAQLNFQSFSEKKLYGYYFINVYDDIPEKKTLDITAMYGKGLAFELQSNLYDKYIFLENILTSDMPTLNYFDENGKPVYATEYRKESEIKNIMLIHKSIIGYFENYIALYDKNEECHTNISDVILGSVDGNILDIDSKLLSGMVLKDDFNGTVFESNSMIQ